MLSDLQPVTNAYFIAIGIERSLSLKVAWDAILINAQEVLSDVADCISTRPYLQDRVSH